MIETDRYALVQRLLHWLIKRDGVMAADEPVRLSGSLRMARSDRDFPGASGCYKG